MEASKTKYSRLDVEVLSEDRINKLKGLILQILVDTATVCDENNLEYMLAYGTLIGAVRHHGFIPWDDDIDIHMRRKDIPLLEKALKDKYGDKYKFVELRRRPVDFYVIELNGTEAREINADNDAISCGVKIDVFPIDNISSNNFIAKLQDIVMMIATKGFSLRRDFRYPSYTLMNVGDKELRKYYQFRRCLGAVFSILPEKFYEQMFLKFCVTDRRTGVVRLSDTTIHVPYGFFRNTVNLEFEGKMFKCPANYDRYLKLIYGDDYMQLPPEDKREVHSYLKLDLGKYEE